MKHLTLLTLLAFAAPFCWGETWVCETFIVDRHESTGKGPQQIFKVKDGVVTNSFKSKLTVIHDDSELLVATDVKLTAEGFSNAAFAYLMLDKKRKIHVYDYVTPPGDASRDEGPCVFVD